MKIEQNYDFIKRMQVIHQPHRRTNYSLPENAVEVTPCWQIRVPSDASKAEIRSAEDFQDYLKTSMETDLPLVKSDEVKDFEIFFSDSQSNRKRAAYTIEVSEKRISVTGDDSRGVLRGGIALEDQMNLIEGPYLQKGCSRKEPVLKARIIHSGCGVDEFPDWQLDAIRHAGFTAIDIFVRDFDLNGKRQPCDIAALIERADEFGLDTVLYNYLRCFKHPDDPDAEEFFDSIYGELFRRYPKAWGISLVGESLEFPSKDERTTGKRFRESVVDGIPDPRPSPGWFPCSDYPDLLKLVVKSITKVKKDVNIVFSTYNWSYLDARTREEFLAKAPKELTINICFEMQKVKVIDGVHFPVMDYTASVTEPGEYFLTESAAAAKNGLAIRVCSNTGGAAWDFGAVPYIPVPQLWLKRMRALKPYALNYGADTFYEGHHFGWWPNIANDLMKKLYEDAGETDVDDLDFLRKLAVRDFGTDKVFDVWHYWSDALTHVVVSNEDQYGPLRVGAAYPFVFQVNITRTLMNKEIPFPCTPGALMGNGIIKTFYQPFENALQSPGAMRYPIDLREMAVMQDLWLKGLELLENLLPQMPEGRKRENGEYLKCLGYYILATIKTVINIKRWYLVTKDLQMCTNRSESEKMLDQLLAIIEEEKVNVKALIPFVEVDSRLGWEPSMEYVCDRSHLEWKLRQMEFAVKEIEQYRNIIKLQ